MFRTLVHDLLANLSRIGADPLDSDDVRQQKSLLVTSTTSVLIAGVIWGAFYWLFDERFAALIPWAYVVASALNVIVYALRRNYRAFRFAQLALILLLPFVLQLMLGGFVSASAVVLWSLLSPFNALLFDSARAALRWFVAYLALVIASAFLQPSLALSNHLPPSLVLLFFVMNIGAISSVAFALLYLFLTQKNQALELLRIEQAKSENLLLNILPPEIAVLLKNGNRTIADFYDGASVLFADLVGFTPMTVEMSPSEMLDLLNEIFSYFDTLVEKYKLEKIRTIGDSYMVASGVPRPRHDHAQALARMALAMSAYIRTRPPLNGRRVDFRIGISSGPLVAGVIGRKKFIYDIWGDSVNTASRMESHGTPGQIQISRATYELIRDEFVCEPRGTVNVKGKGAMETWYLIGVKPTAVEGANQT